MENKQYNSNNITLKDIVQKGIQLNIQNKISLFHINYQSLIKNYN